MTLDTHVVWEMRQSADDALAGGGVRWVALVEAGTYKWTASGSGTNEYYVELDGGGDPSLTEAKAVTTDGTYVSDTNGTLGSLNAGEWDWGDNDTLGYSTVYVRLDDGADPDTKNDKFVSMVFGGGVDYSMQDSAQLSLADFACVIASTTLTTATGGFTAAMVGNIIYIASGTNELVGWYEIVAHTDTNTVTIDRTCCDGVGNAIGMAGKVGGARDVPVDAHFEAWTPGNKMYMEAGTYTLGAANIAVNKDGTNTAVMRIEGYNAVRGDAPTAGDRPLIVAAANEFEMPAYMQVRHIEITITTPLGFATQTGGFVKNCKSTNSSGVANRHAFHLSFQATYIDCEGISTSGQAFFATFDNNSFTYCYAHDSDKGFVFESYTEVNSCIMDTCITYGIEIVIGDLKPYIRHNTIYTCGTGIFANNCYTAFIENNLIDFCALGIYDNTGYDDWYVDYNNFNGNTVDVSGVSKGPNTTANAPGFADASGGDFSDVDSADGFGIRLGVT